MAIQVNTVLPSGVSGTFWKTTNLYVSPDYSIVRTTMTLYSNFAASVTGSALYNQDMVFSGGSLPVGLTQMANLVEASLTAVSGSFFFGGSVVPGV